jgi:hypothetical protein
MNIKLSIGGVYSGSSYIAGPFDISGVTWEGDVLLLAQDIKKQQLLSGYTMVVDDKLTGGTLSSVGFCDNSVHWTLPITPSPTPTNTVTPTLSITPTISQTPTKSVTPTTTPTNTSTPTTTPTNTVTPTLTPTITTTPSVTPTLFPACDLVVNNI